MQTTTARYLITDRSISIYRSNASEVEFIHANHPLFDTLKTFLPRSTEFDVDIDSVDSTQLLELAAKSQYPSLVTACDDIPLDGVRLATIGSIAKRIEAMQQSGIPTQPLIAFWEKLSTSILSIDKVETLLDAVGTPGLPLTWDGNLIAYRRGGFTDVPRLDLPDWMPGMSVGNRPISTQYLQSLDSLMHTCADKGVINEAIVLPQHITDFSPDKDILVRFCTYLGSVPEHYLSSCGDSGLVEIDTQIDEFGKCFYVRRPIDPESAIAAADSVAAYAGHVSTNFKQELGVNLSC